jgi:hypothetical protein
MARISFVTSGSGGTPGGSNTQIQYNNAGAFGGVDKLTFSGGSLVGTGSFVGTFSGSLTKLSDGSDYLLAGSGITLMTGSGGAITITGTGGTGNITGSIASTQIAFGSGPNVINGSANLTFNTGTNALATSIVSASQLTGSLTKLSDGSNYLLAGTGVTLVTGSNGAITINGSLGAVYGGALTVYVDSTNGSDSPGGGTLSKPYASINYAYSQVASLGNPSNAAYDANVGRFVTEKLIFRLAPGRYVGDVTLGFKRARVQLIGNGVQVVGNVKFSAVRADFPASSMEALKASFPSPWTGASAQCTFEVTGEAGGGVEADTTADPFVITGLTSLAFEESAFAGSGLGSNWDNNYGQFNFYANKVNVIGGMLIATSYTIPTTNGLPTSVIEIDGCTIGEASSPIRTYLGAVPYAYLASPTTWSTGTVGSANKAPTGTITLKCHNSTLGAAIGPRLTIGEIDGCRIYDIDRTMLGTVDNGSVTGSTSTSYIGMVVNQFRVYSGTGIPASQYRIGAATGTSRYKMDATSYTTLAFSRNSSGVLTARTLDVGGGVSYDLLDDSRSLGYVPGTSGNWVAPAPTTVQNAIDRLATAMFTLRGNSAIP